MSSKRVLIVSYLFPPAGGVSVQRVLSLAKYLPQHGFEVHVLSAWNPTTPTIDAGLLRQIPAEVRVHRTFTPEVPFRIKTAAWKWISPAKKSHNKTAASEPGQVRSWKSRLSAAIRRVFSPDPEVVWVPFALHRARTIVRRYQIDTVIVTAPPFSAFLIGNALERQFPHIQLISDFRDDWLRFFLGTFDFLNAANIQLRAARIERETVERSRRVVVVTRSLLQEMRTRYPDVPADRFCCIPNGFDPAAFSGFQPRAHRGSHVVVTYTGTVYATTTARYYLEALEQLPEEIRSGVETRFVGRIAEEEKSYFQNRHARLTTFGFIPQSDAMRLMEETDFLLVTMLDPTATTGKIYEYLQTGKPILAVAPEGEVSQLIRETGTGWCVDPADMDGLIALLRKLLDPSGQALKEFRPNRAAIDAYQRPRLVGAFADMLVSTAMPLAGVK